MIHSTDGIFGDIAKGAANIVTFGHAFPHSGFAGNKGDFWDPWGVLETEAVLCEMDEFGDPVTDCPNPEPAQRIPGGVCCPTGLVAKTKMWGQEDHAYLHGQAVGKSTAATVHRAADKKLKKIIAAEGEKTPFALTLPVMLAPGVHIDPESAVTPGTGLGSQEVETVTYPSAEELRAQSTGDPKRTALLAGGVALGAFLLFRGMLK